MSNKIYYKIVLRDGDNLKTVHFAINGSRKLQKGKWITAELKRGIKDGTKGTLYDSGIHIVPTREECESYMKHFRNTDNLEIIPCIAKGIRRKEHSRHEVYLANQIKILI